MEGLTLNQHIPLHVMNQGVRVIPKLNIVPCSRYVHIILTAIVSTEQRHIPGSMLSSNIMFSEATST